MNKRSVTNAFILKMFLASWVISTAAVLSTIHFKTGMVITNGILLKAIAIFFLVNAVSFFCLYVMNESAKKAARRKNDGRLP